MELTVYSAFLAFSTISFFAPFPCRGATEIGFVPGILRAKTVLPIFDVPFAGFPRSEEYQRDFVARKTRPLARAAGSHRDVAVRLAPNLFLQCRRKFAQIPRLEANHRP